MPPRPLVEYFVVCGLDARSLDKEASSSSALHGHIPPLSGMYIPSVVTHFPTFRQECPFDEGAIQTLCLPDGVQLYKNLKQTHRSFHSFLVTREDGSHVYGSALVFPEPITDQNLLNSLDSLQTLYKEARGSGFNSAHQDYFNKAEDELFALKCVCLVTSLPVHRPCRAFLEQLFAVAMGNQTSPLSIESYLYNLLYEVYLPDPGKFLRFGGPLGRISWGRPPSFDLPLCDYSFRELFEMLGVGDMLRVLACVLLEHQLLLRSSDYHKLMLAANCLVTLIFPFSWPHVFVPILPSSQRGFLDAPVPYVMGLRVQPSTNTARLLSSVANVSSLCSVDLDSRVVGTVDGLPDLPNSDSLISQLTAKLHEFSINCPDLRDIPASPMPTPSMVEETLHIMRTSDGSVVTGNNTAERERLLNLARAGDFHNGTITTDLTQLVTEEEEEEEETEDEDEEEEESEKNHWDYSPSKKDQRFSSAVREIFLSYFVRHFSNYDTFIIVPTQSYEQWVKNREQFQNFDKAAFISDQPTHQWPFYAEFLESSIFSAFIDEKVTAMWLPEKTSERLQLFDARVESYRDKNGLGKSPTTPGLGPRSSSFVSTGGLGSLYPGTPEDPQRQLVEEEEEDMEETEDVVSSEVIAESAPLPRQLPGEKESVMVAMRTKTRRGGVFPTLDSTLLQAKPTGLCSKTGGGSKISAHYNSLSLPRPSSAGRVLRSLHISTSASPNIISKRGKDRVRGSSGLVGGAGGGASASFSSHSHAKFISQLMRESRFRVKHMMGSSPDSHSSVEENTHIGTLCDLLERIWGHGLRKRESKSPLWAHLTAYAESAETEEGGMSPPPSHPPSPPLLSSSMSSLTLLSTSSSPSSAQGEAGSRSVRGISTQFRRKKFGSPQLRCQIESILQPPPSSLLSDFLIVRNMRELKTDVGHARAFVRLALEKRSLSRHLASLLAHEELTRQRYKEYAFLRTEEEREQFLFHLLTLTAKDFSCFTNGFMTSTMVYKVLLVGEGKRFGLSTSSPYVTISGEFGDSGTVEIPRGENLIEIPHCNLGPLTCMRVGHDNSGIAPSLLLEMALVHNTTTGQTYRFDCGQWLSRSEGDGSVERFLVAEKVPQTYRNSVNMAALDVESVLPSPGSRRRATSARKEEESGGGPEQLKADLKLAVERLKTAMQSRSSQRTTQDLLQLIHGEGGYVDCIEKVLLAGFKSSRKFSKRLFLWDMVERVCDHMIAAEAPTPLVHPGPQPGFQDRQLLWSTVNRINSNFPQSGKNEKMVLFLCVGLRDHHIATWLSLLSHCTPVLSSLYDPTTAFLRDPDLLHFLIYTLSSLSPPSPSLSLSLSPPPSTAIRLEPLLTQGM